MAPVRTLKTAFRKLESRAVVRYAGRRDHSGGTAAEVIGLREIDFRTINGGSTRPVTREIQKVYHDVIWGKVAKYETWCEYVDA